MSKWKMLHDNIAANKDINLSRPGQMSHLLSQLSPEERQVLLDGAGRYDHHVEMGRHGNPAELAASLECSPEVAKRIHDGLQVDYVTKKLQGRKSDASKKPAPLSRKDVLEVAMALHSKE